MAKFILLLLGGFLIYTGINIRSQQDEFKIDRLEKLKHYSKCEGEIAHVKIKEKKVNNISAGINHYQVVYKYTVKLPNDSFYFEETKEAKTGSLLKEQLYPSFKESQKINCYQSNSKKHPHLTETDFLHLDSQKPMHSISKLGLIAITAGGILILVSIFQLSKRR